MQINKFKQVFVYLFRSILKVNLNANETKRVQFKLPISDLAFVDVNNKWKVEEDKNFTSIIGEAPYWRAEQSCLEIIKEFDNFMDFNFN